MKVLLSNFWVGFLMFMSPLFPLVLIITILKFVYQVAGLGHSIVIVRVIASVKRKLKSTHHARGVPTKCDVLAAWCLENNNL